MTPRGQIIRLLSTIVIIVAAFVGLGVRLSWLHLGPNKAIQTKVKNVRHYEVRLPGTRGRILDCKGRILALDIDLKNIAVDPKFMQERCKAEVWPKKIQALSARLAYLLKLDPQEVLRKLRKTDRQYVVLKKYVSQNIAHEVQNLKERAVIVSDVKRRNYPKNKLMCHVLGFANLEGIGSAGMEMLMNDYLVGREGLRIGMKDGRRHELYGERCMDIAPAEGMNVQLTLDQFLQYMLDEALDEAIKEYHAKGAWAIVEETHTGKILAMVCKPDFNPNQYRTAPQEHMRNRAIAYSYEPGSTVKPLVLAAALNEGLITPEKIIDCENGYWMYNGHPLKDYHAYDKLCVADVLKKSSNIGSAKIALILGADRFESYFRSFGFGQPTGVKLPGEEGGIFRSQKQWSGLSLSRMAFGHEIMVTGLQVLNAINAIANDGFVIRPRVLDRIIDKDGRLIYQSKKEILSRPIRRETAQTLRRLMARTTENDGTGRRAAMERHIVAGKTGTAEKIINGRYSNNANIASFVGFFPMENPHISIIVVIDEPQPFHSGGQVAAPIFKTIAEKTARYLNIPSSSDTLLAQRL